MKQAVVDDPAIARSKFFSPVTYTTCMVVLGCLAMFAAFSRWTSEDPFKFGVYFLIAAIGSSLKLALPGAKGTMPAGFVFVLVGIMELSLPEVMAIAIPAVLIQDIRHSKRPQITHIPFYVSCTCVAIITPDPGYPSAPPPAARPGPFSVFAGRPLT